jgi:hypothetical protein
MRDADHSPPSSAEVKKELELYLLSPKAPPWRVMGPVYFTVPKYVTSDNAMTSGIDMIEGSTFSVSFEKFNLHY